MKAYPVGAATYSKCPDRYAEGAPQTIGWASGAWVAKKAGFAKIKGTSLVFAPSEKWVDLTSGMGAVLLGHQHPEIQRAIAAQMNRGISFPLPNPLEEQVAERLLSMLTWEKAESVRFGKNGADVTTSAVRLARAVTGRRDVAYLDYHGHHDWCMMGHLMNAGVGMTTGSVAVNRDTMYDWLHRGVDPLAAIVIEPHSSAGDDVQRGPAFWRSLREQCDDCGTLLILDEMVTGFRMAPGGGAEILGIEPDLACYGKAMANGLPLSAIVGPWEYMKRYEADVFFSLTHGGEALSLAAADETLRIVAEEDVPGQIAELGREIIALFAEHYRSDRIKYGYPQRLTFDFSRDELGILLEHGVLCAGYANLTLAHVEDEKARQTILDAFSAVLSA